MVNIGYFYFLDFLDFLDFRVGLDLWCLRRVILRRLMPPTSEGTCGAAVTRSSVCATDAGACPCAAAGASVEGVDENKLVSLFPMSLTVLVAEFTAFVTVSVADCVAVFSVSSNSFALVERVSAMDAGDIGMAGKASAIVSV